MNYPSATAHTFFFVDARSVGYWTGGSRRRLRPHQDLHVSHHVSSLPATLGGAGCEVARLSAVSCCAHIELWCCTACCSCVQPRICGRQHQRGRNEEGRREPNGAHLQVSYTTSLSSPPLSHLLFLLSISPLRSLSFPFRLLFFHPPFVPCHITFICETF